MNREARSAPLWPLVALLVVFPYFFERSREGFSAHELGELYLTRAVVDNFSLRVGEQIKKHGDITAKVSYEGDAFAAVPPGLALLAVVPFGAQKLVYSLVGSEPSIPSSMRWLRLVLMSFPVALFLLWLHLFLVGQGVRAHAARQGLLMLALSAPFWLQAASLSGGLLAGMCLLACFMVFGEQSGWPSPGQFLAAGVLSGLAVLLSYPAIFGAVLVALNVSGRARDSRWLAYFFVPLLAAIAALCAYHFVCYGTALTVGAAGVGEHFWGLSRPSFAALKTLVWGTSGLLRTAPVLALAPLGFLLMVLRGEVRQSIMCGAIALFTILFGGMGQGEVALALLFCAWPIARAVEGLASVAGGPLLVGVLSIWSLGQAALALSTYPYFPSGYTNALRDLALVLARDGVVMTNLGQRLGFSGGFSVLPLAVLLVAIAAALAFGGVPRSESGSGWQRVVSVWLFGVSALWWQLSWAPDHADPRKRYRDALTVERSVLNESKTETRLQLRAQAIEAAKGKDSREARLARGEAATAEGDNARALESYRLLYRRR